MATISNIDSFVHTIADNRPVARGSPSPSIGKERPDRFTGFVQLTQKKNRLVNERLEPTQTETNQGLNRMDG